VGLVKALTVRKREIAGTRSYFLRANDPGFHVAMALDANKTTIEQNFVSFFSW
jgi:hypothetical protein